MTAIIGCSLIMAGTGVAQGHFGWQIGQRYEGHSRPSPVLTTCIAVDWVLAGVDRTVPVGVHFNQIMTIPGAKYVIESIYNLFIYC